MEAIWTDPALRDLVQALDYIADKDPEAAIEIAKKIDLTVKRIEQFPESGRLGKVKGTREAIIGNYILAYKLMPNCILITHFVHSSRKFPSE